MRKRWILLLAWACSAAPSLPAPEDAPYEPAARTGTLEVVTDPPGAIASIGMHGVRVTPAVFGNLPVGVHKVDLRMHGFRTEVLAVRIDVGKRTVKEIRMTPDANRQVEARVLGVVVEAEGRTLGTFMSIEEALTAAPSGSVLKINPGTYRARVRLDKSCSLVANGSPGSVTIMSDREPCLVVEGGQVYVEGIRFHLHEGYRPAFAVDISGGHARFRKVTVESDSLAGVGVHGKASKLVLESCDLRGSQEGGLLVYDGAEVLATDCSFRENGGNGVEVSDTSTIRMSKCTIEDNRGVGVLVYDKGRALLEGCKIAFCYRSGLESRDGGDVTLRGVDFFEGNGAGLLFSGPSTRGVVESCKWQGHALASIEIAAEADPVIRDCDILNGEMSGILVRDGGRGTIEGCRFEGNRVADLEIRAGGNPEARACTMSGGQGNGVLVYDQGKGTIRKSSITRYKHAAVEVRAGAHPVFDTCSIFDNRQSGALVHQSGRGVFKSCDFRNNGAHGVEVRGGGNTRLFGSTFFTNGYWGLRVHQESSVNLSGGSFKGNGLGGWEVDESSLLEHDAVR